MKFLAHPVFAYFAFMADYRATSKIESWRAMDKTDLAVSEVESNFFAGEDGQISLIHGTRY